ncbi:hypothetical protein GCM10010361_32380 [Streptomyces olivaceiscleroticus]|uniref:Uncharacterized protein n=1 Tax=Streptomyces olivaceiscleroticus TaxID=68245 RepID=A0ABP3JZC7_9ACTN
MVHAADEVGGLGGEGVEGAVAQPYPVGRLSGRLESVAVQHALAQGQAACYGVRVADEATQAEGFTPTRPGSARTPD